MLARVDPRSRPTCDGFQLEKIEGPNGELDPGRFEENWLLCGIDPARSRERRDDCVWGWDSVASKPGEGDLLKGLWEGVCRAEFGP